MHSLVELLVTTAVVLVAFLAGRLHGCKVGGQYVDERWAVKLHHVHMFMATHPRVAWVVRALMDGVSAGDLRESYEREFGRPPGVPRHTHTWARGPGMDKPHCLVCGEEQDDG